MKKCNHCGFEQEDGKFCGKCGSPLEDKATAQSSESDKSEKADGINQSVSQQASDEENQGSQSPSSEQDEIAATTAQRETTVQNSSSTASQNAQAENDMVEKMKETSKEFWSYFTYYLKQPSHIFAERGNEFTNGIINIVAMLFLFSLSTYFLFRNFMSATMGSFSPSVPFFPIFGNTLFFTAIFILLVIGILFGINKLFGSEYSFKEIISIYGGHLSLTTIVVAAAFILLLVKANLIGMILIAIVFGLAITTTPLYLISSLLTRKSKSLDPFYGYLIYTVAVAVGFIILFTILADSAVGGLLDDLEDIFYYL